VGIYHQKNKNMETKNLVQLRGYVVKDIKSNSCSSGHWVALRIATPEPSHDFGPESQEHTSWHDVVAWDELADQAMTEFVKGSQIEVEGRLAYRSYRGGDGLKRLSVFVKAKSLNHPF
jgi:single-strand DNA-binding protein